MKALAVTPVAAKAKTSKAFFIIMAFGCKVQSLKLGIITLQRTTRRQHVNAVRGEIAAETNVRET